MSNKWWGGYFRLLDCSSHCLTPNSNICHCLFDTWKRRRQVCAQSHLKQKVLESRQLPCQIVVGYSIRGGSGWVLGRPRVPHTMGASKEWDDKEENQMQTVKPPFLQASAAASRFATRNELLGEGFRGVTGSSERLPVPGDWRQLTSVNIELCSPVTVRCQIVRADPGPAPAYLVLQMLKGPIPLYSRVIFGCTCLFLSLSELYSSFKN